MTIQTLPKTVETPVETPDDVPTVITKKKNSPALWRHNADGSYNNKPNDPEYFKKYYQEKIKGKPHTCEFCLSVLSQPSKLPRHLRSAKCLRARGLTVSANNP